MKKLYFTIILISVSLITIAQKTSYGLYSINSVADYWQSPYTIRTAYPFVTQFGICYGKKLSKLSNKFWLNSELGYHSFTKIDEYGSTDGSAFNENRFGMLQLNPMVVYYRKKVYFETGPIIAINVSYKYMNNSAGQIEKVSTLSGLKSGVNLGFGYHFPIEDTNIELSIGGRIQSIYINNFTNNKYWLVNYGLASTIRFTFN